MMVQTLIGVLHYKVALRMEASTEDGKDKGVRLSNEDQLYTSGTGLSLDCYLCVRFNV